MVKATKLSEENKSASLEDMKKTASAIFLKHLDPNKYYRIKSGLFGSRDTVSLKNGFDNSKNKIKNPGLFALKNRLSMALSENNFLYSYKTNFVNHPELYDYTYEGAIYQNGTSIQ